MDRLAGALHLGGGAPGGVGTPSLVWAEGCEPVRGGGSGAEALVLGPAARRRDDIARALARHPENPADSLKPLLRAAGGFAFALWWPTEKRLSIGSDPLGLQSLYYREDKEEENGKEDREVVFGGRLSDVSGPIDRLQLAAFEHFLRFLSIPPGRTLAGEVRRALPGGRTEFPPQESAEIDSSYLFPLRAKYTAGMAAGALELREALKASVSAATEGAGAEAPLGVLLSGGIDSTALLATLREVREWPIVAIHASHEGNPDREFARRMAERFGAEFLDLPLTARDAEESLAWIVSGMEAPAGNASAVANCRAFAAARERGVGRVLSGLGSDELFCGQGKHRMAPWWPWLGLLPPPVRKLIAAWAPAGLKRPIRRELDAKDGPADRHREMYAFFGDEECEYLRGGLARFTRALPVPWREGIGAGYPPGYGGEILQVDLNVWLRGALAPMAGALAAANGVELYLPFCAPAMMNLAAAMPLSWKVRGSEGKRVLRRAVEGLVPGEILGRPPQGFTVPMGEWLSGDLSALADNLLSPERIEGWNLLDPRAIRRMVEDQRGGGRDWSLPIWAWMSFSVWYEQFIAGPGGGGPEAREAEGG